jgi:hypothetical protein
MKLDHEIKLEVERRRATDRMKARFDEDVLGLAVVALIIALAAASLILFGSQERKASDARTHLNPVQEVQPRQLQHRRH